MGPKIKEFGIARQWKVSSLHQAASDEAPALPPAMGIIVVQPGHLSSNSSGLTDNAKVIIVTASQDFYEGERK